MTRCVSRFGRTLTVDVTPGTSNALHPLQTLRFTVGSLQTWRDDIKTMISENSTRIIGKQYADLVASDVTLG